MNTDSKPSHYAFCLVNRAGWKSIRGRLEKFLPAVVGGEWTFVHLEDYGRKIGAFTRWLGKFQMIHDVLSGRAAARAAIRAGATRIVFGTYHNCPWLPQQAGVRYFIYADATIKQLANLGYSRQNRESSRMARIIYGNGVRRQARAGHHFFCMSQWYARALQAEHGVPPGQITIIPPSVDTEYWHPRTGERPPGPFRVVFVGADFMRKGGDVLMEVAAMPEFAGVEWHLVTKSPPATTAANIHCYTGFNADAHGLRDLVQNSDVLVLPTRADCSSIVTIEAGASGIPAIATKMAGVTELIDDGRSGFLLEEPTVANLAAALRQYVNDPALAAEHGRAARKKVVAEFDSRVVVGRIRDALNRVV
jgi:glycosyltransferase involved in cell wall biosynthesis